jgi:hypothetical protein
MNTSQSEILIYQSPTGNIKIDVRLEEENVWLTQQLMAELFQTTQQNRQLTRNSCQFARKVADTGTPMKICVS